MHFRASCALAGHIPRSTLRVLWVCRLPCQEEQPPVTHNPIAAMGVMRAMNKFKLGAANPKKMIIPDLMRASLPTESAPSRAPAPCAAS